jgi:tetratricopeptide (TPR) repeat protein
MRRYLILCLFLSIDSFACLNDFDPHHLEMLSDAEEKKYATEVNHAVQMILEKKYKEAITAFLELEKKYPDRYQTATNLGTAYELVGQIDDALVWIEKGIKLNPSSHEGDRMASL